MDFINSDDETVILISGSLDSFSQEYKSGKKMFDLIFSKGYNIVKYENLDLNSIGNSKRIIITLDSVWFKDGVRNDPIDVGETNLDLMRSINKIYPNKRIVRLVPGSVYLYDLVNIYLLRHQPLIKVIDTKSSAQLAYESLIDENLIDGTLPMHITQKNPKTNRVNMIG